MTTPHQMTATAVEIQRRLGSAPFLSLPRSEVTNILRQVSDEPSARIRERKAEELESALAALKITCFPSLIGTHPTDTIRFFHAETALSHLLALLVEPNKKTDVDLAVMLKQIQDRWDWSSAA